jgi:hypothetical protein
VAVPTFADLLTETIRLTKNKCTSVGNVVQACKSVLPPNEIFLVCVLLLLLLLLLLLVVVAVVVVNL